MPDIHAIVLTLNEEIHIARCLKSIRDICATIMIVDSGSTDRTVEIAKSVGAEVVTNPWVNYATQMNFGIDHVAGRGGWILRIDADEYLCDGTGRSLIQLLNELPDDVGGVCLRLRRIFMGKWLKRGGLYPIWLLRVWRNGRGRCDNSWMDEHVVVQGKVHHAPLDFADHSLRPLSLWSQKHISYAGREAIDILFREFGANDEATGNLGRSRLKRILKLTIYIRLPSGLRSFLYFILRYIVRLGFLEGREGYYFHVLQGLWYRTLVDAIAVGIREDVLLGESLHEAIRKHTGQNVTSLPGASDSTSISRNELQGPDSVKSDLIG